MRCVEKRAAQELFDLESHHVQGFQVNQIRLSQHGNAAAHGKLAADVEMFASLGLDRLIGSNHQQHQINATDAGQHVAYEALVAGDIHEAQTKDFAARSGQIQMCETDVDGDASTFFFFQAIGVDAGQSLDQRGFAVVNVSGGAYDYGLHVCVSISCGYICCRSVRGKAPARTDE